MKRIGMYMALFGLLTIVLPFFNMQVRFLGWIDNWGEAVSWAIKIGLIVVGGVLFFMGNKQAEDANEIQNN